VASGSALYQPLRIAYTINNVGTPVTGTATGIFLNATETALNGMGHNLLDLQVGGVSKFRVANSGVSSFTSNTSSGILNLTNTLCSFVFGGDSTGGYLQPSTASKGISLFNSSGSSYINVKGDSSGILFVSAGLFQLNGTTNAFPAIKRNGAEIDFRLADDSGLCNINAGTIGYGSNGEAIVGSNNSGFTDFRSNQGWQFTNNSGTVYNRITSAGISFGDNTLVATAQVAINSTTKGFLPPRGTNTQMLAIASPATGLIFYDTTNNKLNVYDGTTWQPCW
jgi:hypothetical protein